MSDDELIERLRHTLQQEAAAIRPGPADQPVGHYPVPGRVHVLRRRWPLALVATALAAGVAAGVTLSVLNSAGGGSSRIGVSSSGPTSSPAPPSTVSSAAPVTVASPITTVPAPATTVPTAAPPTTGVANASPATTTANAAPAALARSFQPRSVTFVSSFEGWAAGRVPCGAGWCLALARTTNAGQTWTAAAAPPATLSGSAPGGSGLSVRFADPTDGWIVVSNPTRLWSTHNGGASWQQIQPPGLVGGATVLALEASGGEVWMAVIFPNVPTVQMEGSPVGSDAWRDINTGLSIGAGPVPSAQLLLHGTSGWLLENDRTVIGGLRLTGAGAGAAAAAAAATGAAGDAAAGAWVPWTPPCTTANGSASLAASSATDLVALCQEGMWGPAGNLPAGAAIPSVWLFRSSDGGATFQSVGTVPGDLTDLSVASPAPATIVQAGEQSGSLAAAGVLSASFNGGLTWQTVYQVAGVQAWSDLGFTTLTQGVVIGATATGIDVLHDPGRRAHLGRGHTLSGAGAPGAAWGGHLTRPGSPGPPLRRGHGVAQQHGHRGHPYTPQPRGDPPGHLGAGLVDVGASLAALPGEAPADHDRSRAG